ncbi:MAG: phosphoribosyltransferase family protein [Patescibacteria group bacterium]|jgi:putative phosphoribosyl transferase
MVFADRHEAGVKLAAALGKYAGQPDVAVVALPRGGVVPGRVVADALDAPLDIVVPRKIGAPSDEEYAIGAVTEAGQVVWNEAERAGYDPAKLAAIIKKETAEAARRLGKFRAGLPPLDLRGKMVIIVDDGVATGFTMLAAIATVRSRQPRRIVVAVPVGPPDSLARIGSVADEVIALERPDSFQAIGSFYEEFDQVDDGAVMRLLHPQSD